MTTTTTRPIAVCTWSLGNDPESLVNILETTGLRHIHLATQALVGNHGRTFRKLIADHGWEISCTMTGFAGEDYSTLDSIRETGGIMPDADWPENREVVLESIRLTSQLAVPFLSFHAGFIDHEDRLAYETFCNRMQGLADAAAAQQVILLLETGQETAGDLRRCLEDLNHPAIGVNFDPANMILYDKGDPVEAVRTLAPWIGHVHVKDAIRSSKQGEWGREVPWGDGDVAVHNFLSSLDKIGYRGALAVERESGDQREMDIHTAIERLTGI